MINFECILNKYLCQQGHRKIPSTDENEQAKQLTQVLDTSLSWASIYIFIKERKRIFQMRILQREKDRCEFFKYMLSLSK